MAKLQRKTQKVFCSSADASQIAVFGSMKTGTPVYSSDVETLQSAEYLQGWDDALLNDKAPFMEEMNGVQYGLSYQSAYILQEGIPEWDAGTNYSDTSVVKALDDNNDIVLYRSLASDNLGNALTDSTKWERVYFTTTGYIGQPQITFNFNAVNPPENCVWLEGESKLISGYPLLYAIYGTSYNNGTESAGYFRLPDCRGKVLWGATEADYTAGYIDAGLPNITGDANVCQNGGSPAGSAIQTSSYGGDLIDRSAGGGWGRAGKITLDASIHNAIYGNSATVQPPAIKCRVFARYQ